MKIWQARGSTPGLTNARVLAVRACSSSATPVRDGAILQRPPALGTAAFSVCRTRNAACDAGQSRRIPFHVQQEPMRQQEQLQPANIHKRCGPFPVAWRTPAVMKRGARCRAGKRTFISWRTSMSSSHAHAKRGNGSACGPRAAPSTSNQTFAGIRAFPRVSQLRSSGAAANSSQKRASTSRTGAAWHACQPNRFRNLQTRTCFHRASDCMRQPCPTPNASGKGMPTAHSVRRTWCALGRTQMAKRAVVLMSARKIPISMDSQVTRNPL